MSSYEKALVCAGCGEETGMHHHRVEIFDRNEDADKGRMTTVECGWPAPVAMVDADGNEYLDSATVKNTLYVSDDLEGNPSARRGGIKIHFWCEMCHARTVLSIAQHKGMELIAVEKTK